MWLSVLCPLFSFWKALAISSSSCGLLSWPWTGGRYTCRGSGFSGVDHFYSSSYWVSDLHVSCPLPLFHPGAVGQWANVQSVITLEYTPGLSVQLEPGPLLQQELHKSIRQIRLLVPSSTNQRSVTSKSLTFSFHPHMETTEYTPSMSDSLFNYNCSLGASVKVQAEKQKH